MHAWPGVEEQTVPTLLTYHGGDNIFPTYSPRNTSADPPSVQNYTHDIGKDHMPGLNWYHVSELLEACPAALRSA